MAKKLNFIIELGIYPFDVMVSFGEKDKELFKMLAETYYMTAEDIADAAYSTKKCTGRAILFSGNQSLIRMRQIPETPTEKGVLAHEIFHVVTFIMDKIGSKLEIGTSDEPYAYLTGYITKKIYEKIDEA